MPRITPPLPRPMPRRPARLPARSRQPATPHPLRRGHRRRHRPALPARRRLVPTLRELAPEFPTSPQHRPLAPSRPSHRRVRSPRRRATNSPESRHLHGTARPCVRCRLRATHRRHAMHRPRTTPHRHATRSRHATRNRHATRSRDGTERRPGTERCHAMAKRREMPSRRRTRRRTEARPPRKNRVLRHRRAASGVSLLPTPSGAQNPRPIEAAVPPDRGRTVPIQIRRMRQKPPHRSLLPRCHPTPAGRCHPITCAPRIHLACNKSRHQSRHPAVPTPTWHVVGTISRHRGQAPSTRRVSTIRPTTATTDPMSLRRLKTRYTRPRWNRLCEGRTATTGWALTHARTPTVTLSMTAAPPSTDAPTIAWIARWRGWRRSTVTRPSRSPGSSTSGPTARST